MDSNVGPKIYGAQRKEYRSRDRTTSKKFQRFLKKENVWDGQTSDGSASRRKTRENA